jgi:hypothetical protein
VDTGGILSGIKQSGREADHSPPTTAGVKNAWAYASTLPCVFMVLNPLNAVFLSSFIERFGLYLTRNTLRLRHKAQPVNAVWGNNRYLL